VPGVAVGVGRARTGSLVRTAGPCAAYNYTYGAPWDNCGYDYYADPVYIGGVWYHGPFYSRNWHGRQWFWWHGGWRANEWRGRSVCLARGGSLGRWRFLAQRSLGRSSLGRPRALGSWTAIAGAIATETNSTINRLNLSHGRSRDRPWFFVSTPHPRRDDCTLRISRVFLPQNLSRAPRTWFSSPNVGEVPERSEAEGRGARAARGLPLRFAPLRSANCLPPLGEENRAHAQ